MQFKDYRVFLCGIDLIQVHITLWHWKYKSACKLFQINLIIWPARQKGRDCVKEVASFGMWQPTMSNSQQGGGLGESAKGRSRRLKSCSNTLNINPPSLTDRAAAGMIQAITTQQKCKIKWEKVSYCLHFPLFCHTPKKKWLGRLSSRKKKSHNQSFQQVPQNDVCVYVTLLQSDKVHAGRRRSQQNIRLFTREATVCFPFPTDHDHSLTLT